MRIWIDLSNSPHALLFEPVARRLAERGHEVVVTARDNAQTAALAVERWPEVAVIGAESPGGRAAKAGAIAGRVAALRAWARGRELDVALSHNSYAQIVAARLAGIAAVTAMDFEHQPANHLAFRLARRVLVPAAFPADAARRQGASDAKRRAYPGLKESLYLGEFEPDEAILERIGVERSDGGAVVLARTPPSRAIYHRFANPLFLDCLRHLAGQGDVRCVVLVRHAEQADELERLGLPNLTVPRRAVDARSLMRAADLVLGAGGTMTREAALMGVPTVSLFAGEVPAVDRWLEERGALRRIQEPAELGQVRGRAAEPRSPAELRAEGRAVLERFVGEVEA